MSYIMEYAKEIKPNEEIVEDKGVKVLIDPKAIIYLLGTEMDYKENFHLNLYSKILTKANVVDASPLKFNRYSTFQIHRVRCMLKFINFWNLILYKHQFDHL